MELEGILSVRRKWAKRVRNPNKKTTIEVRADTKLLLEEIRRTWGTTNDGAIWVLAHFAFSKKCKEGFFGDLDSALEKLETWGPKVLQALQVFFAPRGSSQAQQIKVKKVKGSW